MTSLEQRYRIAVDALINIAKSGCLYSRKKEAKRALEILIYKTPVRRPPVFDCKAREQLKKLLAV